MVDQGAAETDKLIAELEERIRVEYAQAEREIKARLDEYLRAYQIKDKKWQEWVSTGKRTNAEYVQWRTGQIAIGERWEEMRQTIAQDLLNVHQIALSTAGEYMPEVYALNHDYATYQIEHDSQVDTSYTLYNRDAARLMFSDEFQALPDPGKKVSREIAEGRALRWNNRHIQSVIMQAILQGNSIPDIATRLSNAVADSDRKAATRNARTMMTNAQNSGRLDSYKRAKGMGIDVRKQWVATLDSRTRHEHRLLDGMVADLDKPFVVEGMQIMKPGDPKAAPQLVYNCRCTLIGSLKGYERDLSDVSLRHNKNLGDMTYDEWKQAKAHSNPILLPEEKADSIRAKYIREYRGYGGPVASGRNMSLSIDALSIPQGQKYVDGKDIYDGWTWDKGKYRFAIDQAIHDQGFDGLPQVVGKKEFDDVVRQSGMIAQRSYVAPDQETLSLYRDSLLHGDWYVDCSVGDATEGQGMYTSSDYTGRITDGIRADMDWYVKRGQQRIENEVRVRMLEGITMDDIREQGISEDDLALIKNGIRDSMDRQAGTATFLRLNYSESVRYRQLSDSADYIRGLADARTASHLADNPPTYKIETMTMAPGSRIIPMSELDDMMRAEGLSGDVFSIDLRMGKYEFFDRGLYATLHGYDAIKAEGLGHSGSYTVILNRTKTYILEDEA